MSTTDNFTQVAINDLTRQGYVTHVRNDLAFGYYEVSVQKGQATANARIDEMMYEFDPKAIAEAIYLCAAKIDRESNTMSNNTKDQSARITELERELEKYKAAVKQLSFDLEMASTNANAAANVRAIRKAALEQASEFVMDWGIPKDGRALEEMCKQIVALKETRSMAITRAAQAMNQFFDGGPR